MAHTWRKQGVVAITATVLLLLGGLPSIASADADATDKEADILLVHGYGSSCSKMAKAKRYFKDIRHHPGEVKIIGYYDSDKDDKNCDVQITEREDKKINHGTAIQVVARDLAKYVSEHYNKGNEKKKSVNIVAHSMGGLVTRVALLGSGQKWGPPDESDPPEDPKFPQGRLNVRNVVTLSTPHRGVSQASKHDTKQWNQMNRDSNFMKRLHRGDSKLNGTWNCKDGGHKPRDCTTDWTLVGSGEDLTVSYDSGIDQGNPAGKKFGYQEYEGDGDPITHSNVRELDWGKFNLWYWHAGGHPNHETKDGWAPLKTAYEAATHRDDNLPQ